MYYFNELVEKLKETIKCVEETEAMKEEMISEAGYSDIADSWESQIKDHMQEKWLEETKKYIAFLEKQ